MTGWIVVWVLGVCAVLAILVNHRYHWTAGWRYSWLHAQHVLEQTEREAVPAPEYGSMILAEERGLYWPAPIRYELAHEDGPDWREQTAADLSPETLDGICPHSFCYDPTGLSGCPECREDSGPGLLPPSAPGPELDNCLLDCDPDCESGPRHCWWIHQPSHKRGWHSPADCPHGPDPGAFLAPALAGIARRYGMEDGLPASVWADRNAGRFDSALDGPAHGHSLSSEAGPSTLAEPSRLADTGDFFLTHLLADGQAYMRDMNDDCTLYSSRFRSARAQDRLDLAARLA